jgi:hypothetical protein
MAAMAVLEASGFPPNVEPCSPGRIWSITLLLPKKIKKSIDPLGIMKDYLPFFQDKTEFE